MSFIMVIAALLVIGFIYWQWKMLKKYALTFDTVKINLPGKYVTINGRDIHFEEIACITVRELPQPALHEKALSRSAFYAYMAQLEFHLTQGELVQVTFNTKAALYQVLERLNPFVQINANIDAYKPAGKWWVLLWIAFLIIMFFVFKSN